MMDPRRNSIRTQVSSEDERREDPTGTQALPRRATVEAADEAAEAEFGLGKSYTGRHRSSWSFDFVPLPIRSHDPHLHESGDGKHRAIRIREASQSIQFRGSPLVTPCLDHIRAMCRPARHQTKRSRIALRDVYSKDNATPDSLANNNRVPCPCQPPFVL